MAEIIGCREADLKIGMEVELALQPVILASGNGAETTKAVYKWKPVMSTDAIQEASP